MPEGTSVGLEMAPQRLEKIASAPENGTKPLAYKIWYKGAAGDGAPAQTAAHPPRSP